MPDRAFTVDVPIISGPNEPMWKRYTVQAPTAAMAREIGLFAAHDESYRLDESRRIPATWAD
jgi:hypothetical protein